MEASVSALEAVLVFIDAEPVLLAAASDADLIFLGASQDTLLVLTGLVEAAQRSGDVRADLVTDDVPRLLLMLLSVLTTAAPVVLATGRELQR